MRDERKPCILEISANAIQHTEELLEDGRLMVFEKKRFHAGTGRHFDFRILQIFDMMGPSVFADPLVGVHFKKLMCTHTLLMQSPKMKTQHHFFDWFATAFFIFSLPFSFSSRTACLSNSTHSSCLTF